MKKWSFLFFGVLFLLFSCQIDGVDTSKEKSQTDTTVKRMEHKILLKDSSDTSQQTATLSSPSDTVHLENGMTIIYFKKGDGEKLKKGDVIRLQYRCRLTNGKVFDGNNRINRPFIPFLVGWNQQTKGWDIALEHLRVGDDVDVYIPAKYARGKDGLGNIVPPNSDIIASFHVLSIFEPTYVVDGVRIWRYDHYKNPGEKIVVGDSVFFNYFVSTESTPRYDDNYKRGEPTEIIVGGHNIVPGLTKALLKGREGDRLMVVIPPDEAYGKKGYLNIVKPNESLFYDIQIAKVIPVSNKKN